MAFSIVVQNDGEDGTVVVREKINESEIIEIFSEFLDRNSAADAACRGSPPKSFTWTHRATSLTGGPEELGDGGVLRVRS